MFAAAAAAAILSSAAASASPVDGADGAGTGASSSSATRDMPYIKGLLDKNNLPTTGQDWISLGGAKSAPGLEYQPNEFDDEDPATARHLRAIRDRVLLSWGGTGKDYTTQFIDGAETYYDEYSQAWRLMGFYNDCDSPISCDGGGEVQYDENGNAVRECARFILWAAVSDERRGASMYLPYLLRSMY